MLIFLFLLFASTPEWSAKHPAAMKATRNLSVALVTGQIDAEFRDRLAELLDQNPHLEAIEIESFGGLTAPAYEAARELNKRNIAIQVRGRCASACAYLWASADNRALVPGARIGLHRGRPTRESSQLITRWVGQRNERLEREALSHAGFPDSLIDKGHATPPHSMLWLADDDLLAAGVNFRTAPARLPRATGSRALPKN